MRSGRKEVEGDKQGIKLACALTCTSVEGACTGRNVVSERPTRNRATSLR